MNIKYTVLATASNIGSAVLGFVAGKKVYDVTDNMVAGVVVGATVNSISCTVSGKAIGAMASREYLNSITKDAEKESTEA